MKKFEFYIEDCFSRLDIHKKGEISKEIFIAAIENDPDILEIFDFLNQGGKTIFTSEDLEKRARDERLSRKITKLEKNLRKVNEFLQEHFPMQNALIEEKNFNTSPSPKRNTKAETPFIPLRAFKEEEKIISPPVVKTNRNSSNYKRVHGFEKNFEKILKDVKNFPETFSASHQFHFEKFELEHEKTNTHQQVLPKSVLLESINPIFQENKEFGENKKDSGYIPQIVVKDEFIFEGDWSISPSEGKRNNNFSFGQNKSDVFAKNSHSFENNPPPKYEKSLSNNFENKERNNKKSLRKPESLIIESNSPFNRGDKIMNTAIALKEMLQLAKEMREDFDKNVGKTKEKKEIERNAPLLRKFTTFTPHNVHKSTTGGKNKPKSKTTATQKKKFKGRSPTNPNSMQNQTVVFLGHQNWNLVSKS